MINVIHFANKSGRVFLWHAALCFCFGPFFFLDHWYEWAGQEHRVEWVHSPPSLQVTTQLGALKCVQPLKELFAEPKTLWPQWKKWTQVPFLVSTKISHWYFLSVSRSFHKSLQLGYVLLVSHCESTSSPSAFPSLWPLLYQNVD